MKINPAVFHTSMHLSEEQLLPYVDACLFCGGKKRKIVCRLQHTPDVHLLKCCHCHASTASRLPTEEFMQKYYSDYYTSRENSYSSPKITIDKADNLAKHIAKHISQYLNTKTLQVLDYGGGDGTVSLILAKHLLSDNYTDIHITIVDYNSELVCSNDERIILAHKETIDELAKQNLHFDVVIASAVIEHLPRPANTLHELLGLLNNDGIFYARTPYKEPFAQLFGIFGITFDLAFPAHLHDLGQEFWDTYFQDNSDSHSYEILESRPSPVARSLRVNFFSALFSWLFKAPWYLFGNAYKFVGGWEIFIRKK